MPARIYEFTLTVPAGTLQSAPLTVSANTEDNELVTVELEIPPGHNGLTGTRVTKSGVPLIPFSANSWITANDYVHTFPVGDYVQTADLRLQAYNTGTYPHTFYYRLTYVDYNPTGAGRGPTESDTLPLDTNAAAADPLSPEALLGTGAVAALVAGDITADDLTAINAPIDQGAATVDAGSG